MLLIQDRFRSRESPLWETLIVKKNISNHKKEDK